MQSIFGKKQLEPTGSILADRVREVNLSKKDEYEKIGETVIVPNYISDDLKNLQSLVDKIKNRSNATSAGFQKMRDISESFYQYLKTVPVGTDEKAKNLVDRLLPRIEFLRSKMNDKANEFLKFMRVMDDFTNSIKQINIDMMNMDYEFPDHLKGMKGGKTRKHRSHKSNKTRKH
jgi:hypothetical protein